MSDPMLSTLHRLLEESLLAWELDGEIWVDADGIRLQSGGHVVAVSRAPTGMPFRWVVTVDDRRRTAASVAGVLRIVRQTFAPGYAPQGLRIAAMPIQMPKALP